MNEINEIFTIGHSAHEIDYFLSLLKMHAIEAVADVRSSPFSRFAPQFNRDRLEGLLRVHGISYVFMGAELGARREEPECYIGKQVDYFRVAESLLFKQGMKRLLAGASKMKIALMCSEKDPLTCHRSILIAKNLELNSSKIIHILEDGRTESHAEAELRLLKECKLDAPDLFASRGDRIESALLKRAKQISYIENSKLEN